MKYITYNDEILCSFEETNIAFIAGLPTHQQQGDNLILDEKPRVIIKVLNHISVYYFTDFTDSLDHNLHILWETEEHLLERILNNIFDS